MHVTTAASPLHHRTSQPEYDASEAARERRVRRQTGALPPPGPAHAFPPSLTDYLMRFIDSLKLDFCCYMRPEYDQDAALLKT